MKPTSSVYVIGGAGAGKSTFTQKLLNGLQQPMRPLEDLYALRNAKNVVTLRGHRVGLEGLYLGCMRDQFPGTDGLDRASSPVGEAWLQAGDLPRFILAEGATLATRRFLYALQDETELLLAHLWVDPEEARRRFAERGSSQDPRFVANTVTRSANLLSDMQKRGAVTLSFDTSDYEAWELGLDLALCHLG